MARAATMLLILVCCAVLATAVYASDCSCTKTYKFQFFEQEGKDKLAFGPSQANGKLGQGYVYDNKVTKDWKEDSEKYGYFGGMYFYTSKNKVHEVSTIFFADIGEEGGTFANAEIHLRGVWNLDDNDEDLPTQELSIVGGQMGLSGAYGTVVFTKINDNTWLVQGTIYVDTNEGKCACKKDARIEQVINV